MIKNNTVKFLAPRIIFILLFLGFIVELSYYFYLKKKDENSITSQHLEENNTLKKDLPNNNSELANLDPFSGIDKQKKYVGKVIDYSNDGVLTIEVINDNEKKVEKKILPSEVNLAWIPKDGNGQELSSLIGRDDLEFVFADNGVLFIYY